MSELEAFRGAEDALGVSIWRIENFKPVRQPTSDAGRFASGDSYILLNVFERSGAKKFNLHFWLGKDTTKDESGTAAFLSASLDDLLGGRPVQYRELQGQESDAFLQLFKKGVQYEEGGVASGFKSAEPEKHKTRLLHIRGTRAVRVAEVPVQVTSLNHGDCFVLDDGYELFQWNGESASTAEKAKALSITMSIKNDERKGKAIVYVLNDGETESENAKHFFALLGVKNAKSVKISDSVSKATEALFQKAKLYKVHICQMFECITQKSDLTSENLFALKAAGKVFVWVGSKVEADLKKKAVETGIAFLQQEGLPADTQIQVIKEKMEPPVFKDNFQKWEEQELKDRVIQAKTKAERAEVDIGGMVMGLTSQVTKQMSIDDGVGTVKVWRVEDFKLVEWPEDKYGQFYAGDSYVIQYTYMKSGSENVILYYWQGRDSTTDEKGASALLASQLDEAMGGAPTQVRLVQNKEPDHFFLIFHGGVIVHLGGLNNEDEGKEGPNKERLYQIKGYNLYDTHAVQVRTAAASLNSGDSFVVIDEESVTVWQGKLCSDEERSFAMAMAEKLAEGKAVSTLEEGSEDDAFWEKLGGKGDYPTVGELPPPSQPARLFQISDSATGGHGIAVREIVDPDQEDLCDDDVMLLDTHNEIYIWVGHNSRENEKNEAHQLAQKYLAELNKLNGRDLETPISVVQSGKEPPTFSCHFLGWDDTRNAAFEDPYTAKLKAMEAEQKADSELAKLAAERRKRFTDPMEAKKSASPAEPETPPVHDESSGAPSEEDFEFKPLVHFFPLDELQNMKKESGIDVTRKEDYLSDADFQTAMGMPRAEWQSLAGWRKKQKKKDLGLF